MPSVAFFSEYYFLLHLGKKILMGMWGKTLK